MDGIEIEDGVGVYSSKKGTEVDVATMRSAGERAVREWPIKAPAPLSPSSKAASAHCLRLHLFLCP